MTEIITPTSTKSVMRHKSNASPYRFFLASANDLPLLAEMEKQDSSREDYFTLRSFQRHHSNSNALILIARCSSTGKTLGYIATRTRLHDILVSNWAVFSRLTSEDIDEAVGLALVRKLNNLPDDYSAYRRKIVTVFVRERNLKEQLFWKKAGFRCEKILDSFFDFPPDAAYLFRRRSITKNS